MSSKKRIENILKTLNEGIYGKEEIIAVSFLGALAGLNTFLLGPPGTAKSLIARRISSVFESDNYFEFLMNKFSTPEEVFGPIKLSELKKDNYERHIDGYLPTADVAFLDEIWKANSAILNSLLTIINEKKFKNGNGQPQDVPLKALISASNEIPQAGQGLEALYDRFLIRLLVPPTEDVKQFIKIIQQASASPTADIKENKITNDDLELWQMEIEEIKLSKETISIINLIRIKFEKYNKNAKSKIYISDRRWQKAAQLLKASAFFCDRKETNLVDTLLLRHCLWDDNKQYEKVKNIVQDAVRTNGIKTEISYSALERRKNDLDKEVEYECFYSQDIFETENIGTQKYYCCVFHHTDRNYTRHQTNFKYFVPVNKIGSDEDFHPVDESLNEMSEVTCNFKGQKNSLNTKTRFRYRGDIIDKEFKLKIQFHKGDINKNINLRLIDGFEKDIASLTKDIEKTKNLIIEYRENLLENLHCVFVPKPLSNIAIESIDGQLERLSIVKTDIEQIQDKVQKAREAQQ